MSRVSKQRILSKIALMCFLLFIGQGLYGQTMSVNDSLPYGLPSMNPWQNPVYTPTSGFYLNTPVPLQPEVSYDATTGSYAVQQTIGNFRLSNPSYLSFSEYQQYRQQQSVREYWKTKTASKGLSAGGELRGPLSIDIGGEAFDKIFGNSTVDIRPQGSSELIFAIKHNRLDNPRLPVQQQRNTTFDFEEKIQMNVIGKIGDKLRLTTNYDTEASFEFENNMKLEYTGYEDEIIKKVEIGNVSLPLNGTLITGSQSLFGVKTQLQFGRATVTSIFSQQKSTSKVIEVEGGAQTTQFDLYADEYEANKHFFLSHYFKDRYDVALEELPFINSPVNITKVEVWVTNKSGETDETRNIVSFMDLGEPMQYVYSNNFIQGGTGSPIYPNNEANSLYDEMVNNYSPIRDITQLSTQLAGLSSMYGFEISQDYEKLERARMLSDREYTFHPQLGYISLNSALSPDEVLAVAFQYTVGGETYQVGEFSSTGPSAPNSLFVKLIKGVNFTPQLPTWELMMKNIYALGAYNLSQEDFLLDVVYENTVGNGTITNYLSEGVIDGIPLIKVMNLDALNSQQERQSDGIFDFIEGITILKSNGRVIFPVLEPFGQHLREQFNDNSIADKYVYDVLYDSTLTVAQQFPQLNKFRIKGSYKSESGAEIFLNAMNIPEGSVTVTAGGMKLEENQDYTVDYDFGKVTIINEGILMAGTPIRISLESNAFFGMQYKTLVGTHVDYAISDDFMIGGSILNLTERPPAGSQKVNSGEEPISNTIWGLDMTYRKESPFITKMVDKLPFLETKEQSTITAVAEFAHLIPGHQRSIQNTAYIDDFEASSIGLDIKMPAAWKLAAVPQDKSLFPESVESNSLAVGYNRAKLSWYAVDNLFYRSNTATPDHIRDDQVQLSNHNVREVLEKEVFPNKDPNIGSQISNLPLFDLAYYPSDRGPYNYSISRLGESGELVYPDSSWAGITRKLETNDFEEQNIEFVEFWMMDPFNEDVDPNHLGGDLYINLGNVSEDVLRDGYKSFENGLPTSAVVENVDTTIWGRVPSTFSIVDAFDNDPAAREFQDVGLDGLSNADEQSFFAPYLNEVAQKHGEGSVAHAKVLGDPSADNYSYFIGADHDNVSESILGRYKQFTGLEGNSALPNPTSTAATSLPDNEDVNKDNTLNESESFFQYKVPLFPGMTIGDSYITDILETTANTPAGERPIKWYQFKVPVHQPSSVVGNIQDFKSIRFMRLFFKNFEQPIVCRFATMELVRGEWRRYNFDLAAEGEFVPNDEDETTIFDVSVVNVEENGERLPINYVLPPGIVQDVDNTTTTIRKLNEQSLVLKVCGLAADDARAAYKTSSFDFRNYKRLKMFVHAEAVKNSDDLQDGELAAFIRLGSDFNNNYYEYEIPLEVTPWGSTIDTEVWPVSNELDVAFELFQQAKQARNAAVANGTHESNTSPYRLHPDDPITVRGNPNLSAVKTIMLGVRNKKENGDAVCGEVWINELRLADFDEYGGWASNARLNGRLADFANVNVAGNMSTVGFGSIEQKLQERQKYNARQYDVSSTFSLDKFFPEDLGLKIPLYVGVSEAVKDPHYNPLDPDITLENSLETLETREEKESLKEIVQDYTSRKSVNFSNVRKVKKMGTGTAAKNRIYDIENWSLSYGYTETFARDINTEYNLDKSYQAALNYSYSSRPKNYKPFAKVKLFRKKYFRLLKDFNFHLLPKSINFQTDIDRHYNARKIRNISNANMIISPTYNKSFYWNRNYGMKYDLTRMLKLNFNVRNSASVDEPAGRLDKADSDYSYKMDTIWGNFLNFGRPTVYGHTMDVTYKLPINKIPLTDWVSVNTKYSAAYNWMAAPKALSRLGNTIDNNNNKQINATLNLTSLYNKVPFLKKINKKYGGGNNRPRGAQGGRSREMIVIPSEQDTIKKKPWEYLDYALKMAMGVKSINLSYTERAGTFLPGFVAKPHALGQDWSMMAPGIPFVLGSQQDITQEAANNGWLTSDTTLNSFYRTTNSNTLNLRSTVEPIGGMRISLTATRTAALNEEKLFRANTAGAFQSFNPVENGNYSISVWTFNTAFQKQGDDYSSEVYNQFKANRLAIARRLAAENPNYDGAVGADGFPIGYGATSQEVLINSFLAAYTGTSTTESKLGAFPKIPLPNWDVTFDGLNKIKFVRKYVKNVSLKHSYRSTYNVGSFATSLDYIGFDDFPALLNPGSAVYDTTSGELLSQNYFSKYEIGQVTLSENFSPLVKVDMTFENSFTARVELKKKRTITMGLNNNQLTEANESELVIGSGYRFKDVSLNVKTAGRQRKISSDLDLKLDFSIRNKEVLIRKLIEDVDQVTAGQQTISMKFTADYVVNSRLNLRLFFDKIITNPFVSNQFPGATTNGGFSIRFTLAQ